MTDEQKAIATRETAPLSVIEVTNQVHLIQEIMRATMKEGEHYGTIPGCGPKPTLLQPGAQKLILTFRLNPAYTIERIDLPRDHREYIVTTHLTSANGMFVGDGVGSCSTMESKYRYRDEQRKCPACGKETIIKGKAEYGGGWLCFAKKGGCGAKFTADDPAIKSQVVGKIENPDIADCYNVCLKIAKKRSLVDATLTRTAASDIFTQDLEDTTDRTTDSEPSSGKWENPRVDEAVNQGREQKAAKPAEAASDKQIKMIWTKAGIIGYTKPEWEKYVERWFADYSGHTMSNLTKAEASKLIDWLTTEEAKKAAGDPVDLSEDTETE